MYFSNYGTSFHSLIQLPTTYEDQAQNLVFSTNPNSKPYHTKMDPKLVTYRYAARETCLAQGFLFLFCL